MWGAFLEKFSHGVSPEVRQADREGRCWAAAGAATVGVLCRTPWLHNGAAQDSRKLGGSKFDPPLPTSTGGIRQN